MRQLKYIDDECFFKELQALKEFKIEHYCGVYDIANLIEDDEESICIQDIENFLNLFKLPEIISIVYTDDYIFAFDEPTTSDLFKKMVISIKNGIKKMNANNKPFKSLEEMHQEYCKTQTFDTNNSSKISINSFNLFKR